MGFVQQRAEVSLCDICSHGEFQGAAGHGAERKNFLDYPSNRHNSIQFTVETDTKTCLSRILTYIEEKMALGSQSVQKSNTYETVYECKIAPSPSKSLSPCCLRGQNNLTLIATPHEEGLDIYWLTCTLPSTIHKLNAHICPCAQSLLLTSRRAILGNHSYRLSTSPILLPLPSLSLARFTLTFSYNWCSPFFPTTPGSTWSRFIHHEEWGSTFLQNARKLIYYMTQKIVRLSRTDQQISGLLSLFKEFKLIK